jgi:hypothetical protein
MAKDSAGWGGRIRTYEWRHQKPRAVFPPSVIGQSKAAEFCGFLEYSSVSKPCQELARAHFGHNFWRDNKPLPPASFAHIPLLSQPATGYR